jgi:dimethylaniline monooxygenase (N-oxide forming)
MARQTTGALRSLANANGRRSVAVIGAGPAGLCAAKYMLAAGFDVTVYEAGNHVGGLWVYENDSGLSSAYSTLHINTDKYITQFSDHSLPPSASVFPHHSEMRRYLDDYADIFDIRRHIKFGCPVSCVVPVANGGKLRWRVETVHGDAAEFDTAIVATGHLSDPRMPDLPGEFAGELMHSHYYREPGIFAGRRVCVLGAGNSAADIAADACTVAARTVMSVRGGVSITPKLIFGVPLTQITTRLVRWHLPDSVVNRFVRWATRVVHGDMQRWGFRRPPAATHPTSHATLIQHIAYQRISVRPGVRSINGNAITFEDGSKEEFDILVAATGYKLDVPIIPEWVVPIGDDAIPLYKRVVPVDWPGLYFVGLIQYAGPLFESFEVQTRWIAALETGQVRLPTKDDMRRDIERRAVRNRTKFVASHRHLLEEPARQYKRDVYKEFRRGGRVARRGGRDATQRSMSGVPSLDRRVEPEPRAGSTPIEGHSGNSAGNSSATRTAGES